MSDVLFFYYGLVGVVKTLCALAPRLIETFELDERHEISSVH
jgi:hypothetical protein